MATTTNFGWETPDDTDLVKDGAAAMRTLGNSIDTSLVDLKGGTTGQILSKASNTDLDYAWINNDQGDITEVTAGTGISGGGTSGAVTITNSMATAIDAKGDLIAGTGADTFSRLAVGSNNQVLTADSTTATGLKWATAAGGLTKISTNTFSSVAGVNIDDCFTSTYTDYLVVINNIYAATNSDDILMQFRYGTTTQTSEYYGATYLVPYTGSNVTVQQANATSFLLAQNIGTGATRSSAQIFISRAGNTSERANFRGQLFDDGEAVASHFAGKVSSAQTYTGLRFTAATSNITGTITIYGLAK